MTYNYMTEQRPFIGAPVKRSFIPKKPGKHGTHLIFILDYSSSMQSCRKATIDGFNELLDSHRMNAKSNKIPTYISLYTFNGQTVNSTIYKRDVRKVDRLNMESYDPNGMTNLYDAIAVVMHKVNKDLAKFKKTFRPDINICILTDGAENASTTYNNNDVKEMTKYAQDRDWGFMFLGANIDAFAVGSTLGFVKSATLQYDVNNTVNAFNSVSRASVELSNSKLRGLNLSASYGAAAFTDAERESSK